jgi:peptidoglycan/LPS O-acetylase OafA/YrhL
MGRLRGTPHQFATLDGLRGAAALAVMILHYQSQLGGVLLPHSYLAVDFFFILSGFVLAHAYEHRLLEGMTPIQFLRLRLIRLYPLYLIGTLIGLVWAMTGSVSSYQAINLLSILSALFFLPDLNFASFMYRLNGPAWSLFFELTANAAYAIGIRRLSNGFLILIVLLSFAILGARYQEVDCGWKWANFIDGLPRVCFGFFAGVLTYRTWRAAKWQPRLPQWAAVGLVVALVLSFAANRSSFWQHHRYDQIALLVFPLIVYCGACREPSPRSRPIFLWLGNISYALYITHWPLREAGESLSQALFKVPLSATAPWGGLGMCAIAVLLAAALAGIDPELRHVLLSRGKRAASSAIAAEPVSLT